MMYSRLRICAIFFLSTLLFSTKRNYYAYQTALELNYIKLSESQFDHKHETLIGSNMSQVLPNDRKIAPIRTRGCVTCRKPLQCERWLTSDQILTGNKKSLLQTSQTRFLLPWLYNGPNNQLFGLRQAAYVALRLNRTLVLPLFHKHFTDGVGSAEEIDANHRLEVSALQSLVRTVSISEYKRHCPRQPDVTLLSSSLNNDWTIDQLKLAEKELDIDLFNKVTNGSVVDLPLQKRLKMPFLPNYRGCKYRMNSSIEDILRHFDSDQQCAFYAMPFREVSFPKLDKATEAQMRDLSHRNMIHNASVFADWSLNGLIVKNTQLPGYVQEIANLYIKHELSGAPYMSMHWRYDKEDFYKFMCTPGGNPQNKHNYAHRNPALVKMCNAVSNTDAQLLSRSLYQYLTHNTSVTSQNDVIYVYVAAPPKALDWLMEGLEKNVTGFKFFNSKSVLNFLSSEMILDRCEFLKTNLNDFVSLVETQLCINSQIFFRSSYSSWSDNVAMARKLTNNENQRFDRRIQSLAFTAGNYQNKIIKTWTSV